MKQITFRQVMIAVTYTVILFALLMRAESVLSFLQYLMFVAQPLLIGIFFALAIDCLVCYFETRLFTKTTARTSRILSVLLSCIVIIGVLVAIIYFSVPEIIETIRQILGNLPAYIEELLIFLDDAAQRFGFGGAPSEALLANWESIAGNLSDSMSMVAVTLYDFAQALVRILLGLIFSIYLVLDKKRVKAMLRRSFNFLFKPRLGGIIYGYTELCAATFKGFIAGQMLEAVILGMLCFIGMAVIGLPYASVISVLIAITSIIPVIGAYIGGLPSALLLLLESPMQALVFLIFLIALQQFEGAVIYPKVVGDAIGIDGLFVFIGATLGVGIGGFGGLIIGVPLVAVVYVVFSRIVREHEKKPAVTFEKKPDRSG